VTGVVGFLGVLAGIALYVGEAPSATVVPRSAESPPRTSARHRASRFAFAPVVTARGGGLRLGLSFSVEHSTRVAAARTGEPLGVRIRRGRGSEHSELRRRDKR
jgi:hypothetical protein